MATNVRKDSSRYERLRVVFSSLSQDTVLLLEPDNKWSFTFCCKDWVSSLRTGGNHYGVEGSVTRCYRGNTPNTLALWSVRNDEPVDLVLEV